MSAHPLKDPAPPANDPDLLAPMTGQRRARILERVNRFGSARVGELAAEFETSAVTIRNDLAQLEREGRLLRDRGGATAVHHTITSLLAVEERAHLRIGEKRRIANRAAEFVRNGDTIIMDAGTTVVEMAPHLAGLRDITVVTNALNVALQVGARSDAHVILVGGTYNRVSSSLLGPITDRQLGDLNVQKLFLGTQAMDAEQGLTDTTLEIAQIKRRMIESAAEVYLLSDSSKWDVTGFTRVAPLSAVRTMVSDTDLPAAARTAIASSGVELIVV